MQISIWEKETFFAPQDVVIIGSGFVGLWSALYLKKKHPKRKITILERGVIPTGASTRNAGFACFGSLTELVSDAKVMGTDKMLQLVELRYRGLERIQKYFPSSLIDFELTGGYELIDSSKGLTSPELQGQIEYINSLVKPVTGARRTYKLADDKIATYGFSGLTHIIKNNREGALHSGKLLKALLQQAQSLGIQVLTGVGIERYERKNGRIELQTNQHFSLSCSQLLVCTNAFARELLPEEDIIPARGQVLLTSPLPDLTWKGTFHYDEGYYYFRNLGSRVLLGGARNKAFADEQTHTMQTSDAIQLELERFLDEVLLPRFRGSYVIEHRWAGIMAIGKEKAPIIREVEQDVFCAVRMSGMGVALAPIAGEKVAGLMG